MGTYTLKTELLSRGIYRITMDCEHATTVGDVGMPTSYKVGERNEVLAIAMTAVVQRHTAEDPSCDCTTANGSGHGSE